MSARQLGFVRSLQKKGDTADASAEPAVSRIVEITSQARENERRIVEIKQPIRASEWAEKVTQPGDEPEKLPYDSLIEGVDTPGARAAARRRQHVPVRSAARGTLAP